MNSPLLSNNKDKQGSLQIEQVRLLYTNLPTALIVSVVLAGLLVMVQLPVVNQTLAIAWLILMLLLSIIRMGTYLFYRRTAAEQAAATADWLRYFRAGAITAGLLWGSSVIVIFPTDDIVYQVTLAYVLAGVSIAAIISLSVDRISTLGFVLLTLIPLMIAFVIEGKPISLYLGLMVGLLVLFIIASTKQAQHYLLENALLRIQAQQREARLRVQQQLSEVITRAQSIFIQEMDRGQLFNRLLADTLTLTRSQQGFIGEVLHTTAGLPYLKAYTVGKLSGKLDAQGQFEISDLQGMELHDLKPPLDTAISTGKPMIANNPEQATWKDSPLFKPIQPHAILAMPVHHNNKLVALLGIANRPDGYDQALVDLLHPLGVTLGQLVDAARLNLQHRESERRLTSVIEGTHVGIWEWNLQSDEIFCNERWANIVGYSLSELAPINRQTWMELIDTQDRDRANQQMLSHMAGDLSHFDIDYRMHRKDGQNIWVHDRGRVISWTEAGEPMLMSGTRADITVPKKASMDLQRSEARLRELFELSPVGIALINYATGAFVEINDALLTPTGYSREELLSLSFTDITPEEYLGQDLQQLEDLKQTGHYGPYEKECLRKDGSRYPVLLNGMLVHGSEDMPLIWTIVEDISERNRVDRMKNEFVSTISHELRTPLTAIAGALGLIDGGALGELPAQARQMIAIAYKNSQHLTQLIDDLLDMEKLIVGGLHFDLQLEALMPIIEQALKAVQAYGVERQVTLALTSSLHEVRVQVDRKRLMQVLSNLISNAIKYSPPQETVEITVEGRNAWVRTMVRDHGPGIPAEFHERIFEKFAQADSSDSRQKEGTGLGLAITKELVERMGGQIGFASAVGEGASFYFDLPISSEPIDVAG